MKKKNHLPFKVKKINRTPEETMAILESFSLDLGYPTNAVDLVKKARAGKL